MQIGMGQVLVCGEERGEGVHHALSRTRGEEVAGGAEVWRSRGSCQQARCRAAQEEFGSWGWGGAAARRRQPAGAAHPRRAAAAGTGEPTRGGARVAAPQRLALHFFSGSALPVVGRPTYTLNCGRGASGICRELGASLGHSLPRQQAATGCLPLLAVACLLASSSASDGYATHRTPQHCPSGTRRC